VPGLGPKGIAVLWQQGGVTSLADLKAKLEAGTLVGLPGYGPKKLANLQKNLAFAQTTEQRIRIGTALPLALWFVQQLRKVPGAVRVEYAGSLRRGRETIGDIDLIAAAASPEAAAALSDAFAGSE